MIALDLAYDGSFAIAAAMHAATPPRAPVSNTFIAIANSTPRHARARPQRVHALRPRVRRCALAFARVDASDSAGEGDARRHSASRCDALRRAFLSALSRLATSHRVRRASAQQRTQAHFHARVLARARVLRRQRARGVSAIL